MPSLIVTPSCLFFIVVCYRCDAGTLGADLIANGGDRVISLDVKRRVKLTGTELEEHLKKVTNS